jgi:hypothetical protein
MNETAKRVIYWTPRILCIAFAGFLGIFAMDVFSMHLDFWHTALALLMHTIPVWIILLVLMIVWRREWVGAILFPLLAVFHLVSKWSQLDWTAYAIIEGPLLLLGALFWISWRNRETLQPSVR